MINFFLKILVHRDLRDWYAQTIILNFLSARQLYYFLLKEIIDKELKSSKRQGNVKWRPLSMLLCWTKMCQNKLAIDWIKFSSQKHLIWMNFVKSKIYFEDSFEISYQAKPLPVSRSLFTFLLVYDWWICSVNPRRLFELSPLQQVLSEIRVYHCHWKIIPLQFLSELFQSNFSQSEESSLHQNISFVLTPALFSCSNDPDQPF